MPAGPSALVLHGEAGIGKTTLWHESVSAAVAASYLVISCRPTPAEADLPYIGLGDLFTDVPEAVLADLPGPQRVALEVALLRVANEAGPQQRRAVAVAVLNTLLAWARSVPLVVAIDDLQWLDVPTMRALQFAVRRLRDGPVGFVTATRTTASGADPLDFASGFGDDHVTRLPVTPLDLSEIDLLLRSHLQTAFLAPVLRRIEQASGGNPFYALELGRAMLNPTTSTSPTEPLAVPSSLAELLGVRIARLSRPVRTALVAAAALAHPTVEIVAQAAADHGRLRFDAALDAGVITVRDGLVVFTHPLLASVVYSQASSEERRRIHTLLAGLVSDPDERARHLGLGVDRPDGEAAAAIAGAAARAASRGAPDTAAALFEQAAQLTPPSEPALRARRQLDSADSHIAAGETARARDLLNQCLAGGDTGTVRARALHRAGTILMHEGEFLAAENQLRAAAATVSEDLPLRAAIERDIAYALLQAGSPGDAVPHAEAELRAAESSAQPVLIAEALDHLCMVKFLSGQGLDSALLTRAVALDDEVGPAPPLAHPGPGTGRFPLALTLKWTDRFDAARELLRSLYDEHAAQGDEAALAVVVFHLGELECWAGNLSAAAHLAEQGRQLGARTAQGGIARRAVTLQAMVDAHRGDIDATRAGGLTSLDSCEKVHDALGVIRNLKSLGLVELSVENHNIAAEHLRRAVDLEAAAGYNPSVFRVVPDAIESFVATGHRHEAEQLIGRLDEASALNNNLPWAAATRARCRGIMQASAGDVVAARESLESSLSHHERLPQPFERARTLLVAGSVERRAKQKRAARDLLEEAHRAFDQLGALRWASRARAELARVGGRPPSPRELSATERRIAQLVVDGQTNREIAAAMFLSEKTVEAHLTHIYRKLGVDSRRQLVRHLGAQRVSQTG